MLIGRENELDTLAALLADPAARSTAVLVEGAPGSGKSALLRAALERTRQDGDLVLTASGAVPERAFAHGVVRQLFERLLAAEAADGREQLLAGHAAAAAALLAPAAPRPAHTDEELLNGLHWLTVNLTGRGRLVLVVDDLQWADEPSLRWLHYLLRRSGGLPLVVIATLGPGTDPQGAGALGALLPLFRHQITLPALGSAAVVAIVRDVLGEGVDEAFGLACHTATGGNPFLLHALLRTVRAGQHEPATLTAKRLAGCLPPGVARAVHGLVCDLGPDATAVAQATAVLGSAPTTDLVAGVAGLGEPAAEDAADALVRAGLLVRAEDGIAFACPVIAEAVAAEILPSRRQQLHAAASSRLLARGAALEEAAGHLLDGPLGLPGTPEVLRRAAAEAARLGGPERAVAFLRRALRESMDRATRATLTISLGEAELASNVPAAVGHLRRGLELSWDPVERTAAARTLSGALFALDRYQEGLAVLRGTSAALRPLDPANALRLEVDFIYGSISQAASATSVLPRLRELGIADAEGTAVERPLAALLSLRAVMAGERPEEVVELARQALSNGLSPLDDESGVYAGAILALGATGQAELALMYTDAAVEEARARGSAFAYALASSTRAGVHCRLGRVLDSRADAANALEALEETGITLRHSHCAAPLTIVMDALIKQGNVEYAAELLERAGLTGDLNGHWINDYVLLVRGRLRVAQGRLRDGLADFLLSGRRCSARSLPGPGALPWRAEAALALAALDERESALVLAQEDLTLAQEWGVPEFIGSARRTLGLVTGGSRGLELLGEAVGILEETTAQYKYAQALADHGGLLRAADRPAQARVQLQRAASVAHRLGAAVVAEQALAQLRAAGDRPRTRAFQGVDALTPTERRVAGLAAKGMTNREIAQHLFVGLRTVEVHLTNTYGKLGIHGRSGLAEALCRKAAAAGGRGG
ncbi:AAA family ATPase [Kitasatospora sp. NPDC050543]|uniref:helix-turn-helix transcriptional regulator n=1 Tax=Kitasatospora sp. NPDC050543 TaxID=3364054 RepID=UPI00378C4B6A